MFDLIASEEARSRLGNSEGAGEGNLILVTLNFHLLDHEYLKDLLMRHCGLSHYFHALFYQFILQTALLFV